MDRPANYQYRQFYSHDPAICSQCGQYLIERGGVVACSTCGMPQEATRAEDDSDLASDGNVPQKNKGGRPKGSKNRPKEAPPMTISMGDV